MGKIWSGRRFVIFSAVALLGLGVQSAIAQRPGGAGSAGSGLGSTGTRGTTNSIPGNSIPNSAPTTGSPSTTRPIFLSGKVMFDDGTAPNVDIRIERVCGGVPRLETHTDSKGQFSFQVGQNASVDTDAADPTTGGSLYPSSGQFPSQSSAISSRSSQTADPLWNCELRASYPGYRSDLVELAMRRSLDNPDLGTLILHRLSNVAGSSISLTTALAPKNAQKDYEKGLQLAAKGDFEQAEKRLVKATDAYPKYAIAWFALGEIQQKQGNSTEARKSYAAAIAADAKYVSPYNQLAVLSAQEGKWQDAADYTNQVIQLNPVEFPSAFWLNAIANYNLKRLEEAEKSAKELLKVDAAHKFPEGENLLGQIFLEKGNYAEAAAHLRAYLVLRPNAKNADSIKQALAKLDQANSEAKK